MMQAGGLPQVLAAPAHRPDAQRLQPAHLVDGAAEGRDRLPLPAADDDVHDLGRTPCHRPDAEPARPEPGRALRPAAAGRRRAQAAAEGRHHPPDRGQAGVHRRAGDIGGDRLHQLLGHPVGPGSLDLPSLHPAAAHRPAGGGAAHPGDELGRRVRDRAGRLVLRVALLAARRAALRGAGDQLRDRDGPGLRGRVPRTRARCPPPRSSTRSSTNGTRGCCRSRS